MAFTEKGHLWVFIASMLSIICCHQYKTSFQSSDNYYELFSFAVETIHNGISGSFPVISHATPFKISLSHHLFRFCFILIGF